MLGDAIKKEIGATENIAGPSKLMSMKDLTSPVVLLSQVKIKKEARKFSSQIKNVSRSMKIINLLYVDDTPTSRVTPFQGTPATKKRVAGKSVGGSIPKIPRNTRSQAKTLLSKGMLSLL